MSLFEACLDWIFPPTCAACEAWILPGATFCDVCAVSILPCGPPCPRCGKPLESHEDHACLPDKGHFPLPIWAAAQYGGDLSRAIYRFKCGPQPRLAAPLTRLWVPVLSRMYKDRHIPQLWLPVPLSRKRALQRGFNQSYVLAKAAYRHLAVQPGFPRARLPVLAPTLLRRSKHSTPQTGLPRALRQRNVTNAFVVDRKRLKGKDLLVIDDVVTTGATLKACAEASYRAGARSVQGLALAYTPQIR